MLEVKNITVQYYKVPAVRDISIHVERGTIVTLIGSNGAGKSTILRAICGLKHPTIGEIWFKEQRIDNIPTDQVIARGVAMVPEGRHVFPDLTVIENLTIGAFLRRDRDGIKRDLEEVVFQHFPRLEERQKQLGGTLSGGEQQMLAMGRALMSAPELLILDEPSLGLSPIMCEEISKIIQDINASGKTVILVEQNARMALSIANYAYVLTAGLISMAGMAEELCRNEAVQKSYLGG